MTVSKEAAARVWALLVHLERYRMARQINYFSPSATIHRTGDRSFYEGLCAIAISFPWDHWDPILRSTAHIFEFVLQSRLLMQHSPSMILDGALVKYLRSRPISL